MCCAAISEVPHFNVGGSVHLIVNNQIGFTTPAINGRSGQYSSDIGKMVNAPVVHVNADRPEVRQHGAVRKGGRAPSSLPSGLIRARKRARTLSVGRHSQNVVFAARIANAFRHEFHRDVIMDLIGYRRWGHNELDEPAFTQPIMYREIRTHKTVPTLYEEKVRRPAPMDGAQRRRPRPWPGRSRHARIPTRSGRRPPAAGRGRIAQHGGCRGHSHALLGGARSAHEPQQDVPASGDTPQGCGPQSVARSQSSRCAGCGERVVAQGSPPRRRGRVRVRRRCALAGKWAGLTDKQPRGVSVATGVDVATLTEAAKASVAVPPNFEVHPRLIKRCAACF